MVLTKVSFASFPIQDSEVPDNMPSHLQILVGLIFVAFLGIVYYFYKKYRSYNLIEGEKVRKKTIFQISIALVVLGLLILGMSAMAMN